MMVATVVGGQGSADSPGPNDAAIADGFLGLALRRVSDGAYVDFVRNPCNVLATKQEVANELRALALVCDSGGHIRGHSIPVTGAQRLSLGGASIQRITLFGLWASKLMIL